MSLKGSKENTSQLKQNERSLEFENLLPTKDNAPNDDIKIGSKTSEQNLSFNANELKRKQSLTKINLKNRKNKMAFKFALVLLVLLIFSFSALSFILIHSISKDNIETYAQFTTSLVEQTADGITYWLEGFFKDFGIFTNSQEFKSGDFYSATDYLQKNKQLIDPNFEFMGFADVNGFMIDSNGNKSDISSQKFFTAIQTSGKSKYISDPMPALDGIGYIFYIAIPVTNANNAFCGVMVGALPLSKINYQITQNFLTKTGITYAIDSKGNIIAHTEESKIMKNFYSMSEEESGFIGYKALTEKMLLSQTGSAIVKNTNNDTQNYVFYCPINHTEWSLAISITEEEINATAKKSGFEIITFCIIIAVLLMIFTSVYMTFLVHPLTDLKKSITEIASRDADLTKKIKVRTKDEVGDVVTGFNTFTENLRGIISQIKDSKDELSMIDSKMVATAKKTRSSINDIISNIQNVSEKIKMQSLSVEETAEKVDKITSTIEDLNLLIENQSSGVTQASAAVEQMLVNILAVTRNTENMVSSFRELEQNTITGIEKQNIVDEQIQKIKEQSKMLMEANKVISKIANETNLLAMNASIEAAHAGSVGSGFSVVADEIHNLSENSSKQSRRIRDELKMIQESIESVVATSSQAKESFHAVTTKIQQTDQIVLQIKSAMEESEIGSRQITEALKMMNISTFDVRNASSDMSDENAGILNQVKQLQEATEHIKASVNSMTDSANQINDNGQTLSAISEKMEKSIYQIASQIDLFNV
ncbi:methyl-accepting chemotaxis protein [Treponema pectinovorum]|uniref:methyl-accepting chemotaxis protein n=1 Tax=Treponema pectinovorum TaxID=164 RepID=UPI0011F35B1D|nr:methyl-accepting chemotaxis protein [Treponema pectinovorum]